MNVDPDNSFWSEDALRRQKFICKNFSDVVRNLPSLVLAAKMALLEERDTNNDKPKTFILGQNITQLCSMVFDAHHFGWESKTFGLDRFPYCRHGDEYKKREYDKLCIEIDSLDDLVTADQIIAIKSCARMFYFDERDTLSGVICELAEAESLKFTDWSAVSKRLRAIYPHGCNYIIEGGALWRLAISKNRTQILAAIFASEQEGQYCNLVKMAEGLAVNPSSVGWFCTISRALELISETPGHPMALDAFHSWCILQALYCNYGTEMDKVLLEWNKTAKLGPELSLRLNCPRAGDDHFNNFILSVPSIDRKDLKILILGTAILINASGPAQIEKSEFVLNPSYFETLRAEGIIFGRKVPMAGIVFCLSGTVDDWLRRSKHLFEAGACSRSNIELDFASYWIHDLFNKLDYEKEDIGSTFFRNRKFWGDRKLSL